MSELNYEKRLLSRLVAIKTITGNSEAYQEIASFISNELNQLGLKVDIFDGEAEAKDNVARPNIVSRLDAGAPQTLGILTHYDVVPPGSGWDTDPFNLVIKTVDDEARAIGRGAADDKGCICATIAAIKYLVENNLPLKWNILFMCTADEEIGGMYGAGYLARNRLVDMDALVVLDSSSMGLVIGTSGIMHGDIEVLGRQGHAGYIFSSQNALHKAITFLNVFLEFTNHRALKLSNLKNPAGIPIPQVWGRYSLTWIKTDTMTYNIIPGRVTIGFDMRLLPEEDPNDAIAELKSYFEMTKYRLSMDNVFLRIRRAFPGYMTDKENPFVKKALKAALASTGRTLPLIGMLGGNDGGWFRDYNIPIISFGAWDERSNIHGPNESVSLKKIEELKNFIIRLVTD